MLGIERESCSLSILILFSTIGVDWSSVIRNILLNLVDKSGVWAKGLIMEIEREGTVVKKAKHSMRSIKHRAQLLKGKLI